MSLRCPLWLAPFIVVVVMIPLLRLPLERDEGEYAWAAEIWARGGLPYRDSFLQKPPGIILAYATFHGLFGGGPVAVHVALLAIYVATVLLVGALARRAAGPDAVLPAACCFAFGVSVPAFQGQAFNTEALVMLGSAGAGLALWRLHDERRWQWVLAAAAAASIAMFGKQVAAPFAAMVVLSIVGLGRSWTERTKWGAATAGLVAFPYLVAISYAATRGALPDFLDGVLLHNLEYTGQSLELATRRARGDRIYPLDAFGFVVAALSLVALGRFAWQRAWWPLGFFIAWLVAAWVGVSAGGHYRGHYFLQLLPLVVILATSAWLQLRAALRVLVAVAVALAWVGDGGMAYGQSPWHLHVARYGSGAAINAEYVAGWLRRAMDEKGDRSLYVLASEPTILEQSDAVSRSRYVIQNPLFGGYRTSRARQEEVWRALVDAAPAFLVTVHDRGSVPAFPGSDTWLLEKVDSLARARYVPVAFTWRDSIGLRPFKRSEVGDSLVHFIVHVRRDGESPATFGPDHVGACRRSQRAHRTTWFGVSHRWNSC
jgi:4-amino-4-deoxy-L-arabinose transferase-like glycosyltransferase